jgi:TrpR family trp operon transcriptional repressor
MKKETIEDGWRGFLELCSTVNSSEDFGEFFDLFLTIEEKETLASRFLIVRALMEGKMTQREIAKAYKVSIAQITRGSNALKIIDNKLIKFLKNQKK